MKKGKEMRKGLHFMIPDTPIKPLQIFHSQNKNKNTMSEIQNVQTPQSLNTDQEAAAKSNRLELSVDEIIEDHIGAFGLSQIIQVLLVSLAWIFDSQNTLVTIFSDAQPQWTCLSSSLCASQNICEMNRSAWQWVGGSKTSTIAEWNLICGHKFKAGVPASLFFIGSLFGSTIQGKLADAYLGRKKTILLSCLLTSATSFLTSLSPNIWIYSLLRFANGFSRAGVGICCLVLSSEVVGRKWRGQVGQYGFFFFTLGFLSLPLIAFKTRESWRYIYRVISILPLVYSILFVPFIAESPRWLIIKGRKEDAMKVLKKLAKLNGKKLPCNLDIQESTVITNKANTKKLWSTKWAVKRVALVMISGFGIGFVYYGVQLNVENLNFNLYFTVAANALTEIPAVFLGSVLLSVMPRRMMFSSSAIVAGVASILCVMFTNSKSKSSWGQLGLEAVGFMAASLAYDVLYIYSVELFPTNVRNFAVSMSRLSLMLGAAIAPVLVVLGRMSPRISFVVFGGLSVFSGVVAFWLPETKDAPLYETLEEQEREEEKLCRCGSGEVGV